MSISVLICVFNDENGIGYTLESICNQTFRNIEILVINDGSTDDTEKIIKESGDERIVYYKNEVNIGLTRSLIKGLNLCKFNIVARIDSGDTCEPSRLELQYNYFIENQLNLLGSNALFGKIRFPKVNNWLLSKPLNDFGIKYYAFMDNPFVHSSIIFDLDFLRRNTVSYNENFIANQDYDLWTRLLLLDDIKVKNCASSLVNFNFNLNSISRLNKKAYHNNSIIISNYFKNYFKFSFKYFITRYLKYTIRDEKFFFLHACFYVLSVALLFIMKTPKSFFSVSGVAFKFVVRLIIKLAY